MSTAVVHARVEPRFDPLFLLVHVIGRLVALLLMALVAGAAFNGHAGAAPAAPKFVTPGDMHSGGLLLQSTEGHYVAAPLVGTDVDVTVSGPTLRARVTQMFHNPSDGWVEGVYVYPLADGAAVDTLKMVVGERIIVGEIKERQQARATYEQARANGQKAALVEQERPNLFTNSVANIGPHETVVVQLEYQEPVHQSGDTFSLRLPLVVGPRYNPAPVAQTVDFRQDGTGWGRVSDPVPDRDRISPPVLDPRQHAPVNPVAITVRLQAGFPLGEVKSAYHAVRVDNDGDSGRIIRLADDVVPADRDFELTWKPAATAAPSVGLFRQHVGDADYVLTLVTPPVLPASEERRPREVVFVIDNSGSMGGTSILQAKASLLYALGRLQPADRFNVIRFDHTMDVVFADTVPADAENLAKATAFVRALQASGGTEMVPPMRAALTDRRDRDANTVRQVVFLTDGGIGNERELFETIGGMLGRSRLFMVGIGSAPNSFLMTRAAEIGRGTYTHIGSVDEVEERMRALFAKLESPAVTNLTASFSGVQADSTPLVLPDLYRGEPLALTARMTGRGGSLQVKGMIGDRPWVVTLPLDKAAEGAGLSQLWARRKITDAELARTMRNLTPEDADKRILTLALEHHLVTRLTSLVAVDETPSRPDGEPLSRADVPLNLPAGWDFDKVFGGGEGKPAVRQRDADADIGRAYAQLVVAHAQPRPQTGVALPKTATDAELRLWAGLLLCAFGLMLAALARRRRLAAGLT